ncbi:NAD-dependent epimerase/dehydratase family protein [Nocardia vermiculata]|uniref:NAD-dependent epimerase/dehydratase family protein n=1 Tax=Nocardia vermiculata TaxID=257274 RepID=A0A846Y1I1_9NOCA|nr:NAD-dependent epimerase/dehydratase family protein [Nocardia vermiculata]NKY52707.1 NAD-dependent epimerase/dehydratase family protein [Nocardia vermiculata]
MEASATDGAGEHPDREADSTPPSDRPARPVLVTGAFGLVGSAVVRRLADEGIPVVATDLDTPANRRTGAGLPRGVQVRWADLTISSAVQTLLQSVRPVAIIHLAAVIPPVCYQHRGLARAVNVGATATLLEVAAALAEPPRFVQASSIAVYGARNPHRGDELLTAETPRAPSDIYGAHKVEAEDLVRNSSLEWVILRLGGVLSVEPMPSPSTDLLAFEAAIPADGKLQTVDVRDVAAAMVAATSTPHTGEVFLIGGDESHRLRQSDIGSSVAAASGMPGVIPEGLPGDPDRDDAWFATDWMDTEYSQKILQFQHHSFPGMLDEIRARTATMHRLGFLTGPLTPAARWFLRRLSPYRGSGRSYADPWTVITERLGDTAPDRP